MRPEPTKAQLRERIKRELAQIDPRRRAADAEAVAEHLMADPAVAQGGTVLAYASFGTELSLDPLIRVLLSRGRGVAIPSIDWARKSMSAKRITNLDTDLTAGRYDIRVPRETCAEVDADRIGVILLPGLAFDARGNRLGRGAGFYDRYIDDLRARGLTPTCIGVCFAEQIVARIPTEDHDHRVDRVITQRGTLEPDEPDKRPTDPNARRTHG